jgi:hypothetical protein
LTGYYKNGRLVFDPGQWTVHVRFVVENTGTGMSIHRSIQDLSCQHRSTKPSCAFDQKDKPAKPANLNYSNAPTEIGGHWIAVYWHIASSFKALKEQVAIYACVI